MAPAPPEDARGGRPATPMMPRGGGHSNPRRPLSAGQKMAASGTAVAPARAPSPTSPLLIAGAPLALDRGGGGGGMRPRRSGQVVACPSVSVVFPGAVSRESCCRFACEFLKHVLHQRHQLPLPYEQLAYFCRRAAQVRGPWARGGYPWAPGGCVCVGSVGPGGGRGDPWARGRPCHPVRQRLRHLSSACN